VIVAQRQVGMRIIILHQAPNTFVPLVRLVPRSWAAVAANIGSGHVWVLVAVRILISVQLLIKLMAHVAILVTHQHHIVGAGNMGEITLPVILKQLII
jgi:hypothetical protein